MTITSEKKFKSAVLDLLRPVGYHFQRHEDKYETGIPDTSYGIDLQQGFIEFKWMRGVIRPAQETWLNRRCERALHVWVMRGWLDGKHYLLHWRTGFKLECAGRDLKDWVTGPVAACLSLPSVPASLEFLQTRAQDLESLDRELGIGRTGPSQDCRETG